MSDPTETARRVLVAIINAPGLMKDVTTLRSEGHEVWDTTELQRDFEVTGFMAPFVGVRRKSDGVKGTLLFANSPRIYFGFEPE